MNLTRTLLFLIGCLGSRSLLAVIAKNIQKQYLPYMGMVALIPAFGFLYLYLNNLRQTGEEAGGKIWWNKLRPVHAFMYLLFATYAFKKEHFAWIVLAVDVIFGFILWIIYRVL